MSLLKSPTSMVLCVGWCFVRMVIWVMIAGIRFMSCGCNGMYIFRMRSGVSGLLDTLKACK